MIDTTSLVRDLNDRFRQGDRLVPGEVFLTPGIAALINGNAVATSRLFYLVQTYARFEDENDPHGEHDFGAFEFQDQKCFWKIDVYDHALKWAAPNPSDIKLSRRVMTIMLASEY